MPFKSCQTALIIRWTSDELHLGTRWGIPSEYPKNPFASSVRRQISEVQGRISSILTPTHHAPQRHIHIHADETNQRNGESIEYRWLFNGQLGMRYSKFVVSSQTMPSTWVRPVMVVVTDQCASLQLAGSNASMFNAICKRWRNTLGGQTAYLGRRLVLLFKSVFRK